jgi:predicted GNAT family acetyltransferase
MITNRQHDDEKLDESLDETFPASDAPANTVETGIRTGESIPSSQLDVADNRALSRFELIVDGRTAFLAYERTNDSLTLIHTEVPLELRGRRYGEALVEAALGVARSEGLRVSVVCPFARAYLRRHPPSPPTR